MKAIKYKGFNYRRVKKYDNKWFIFKEGKPFIDRNKMVMFNTQKELKDAINQYGKNNGFPKTASVEVTKAKKAPAKKKAAGITIAEVTGMVLPKSVKKKATASRMKKFKKCKIWKINENGRIDHLLKVTAKKPIEAPVEAQDYKDFLQKVYTEKGRYFMSFDEYYSCLVEI